MPMCATALLGDDQYDVKTSSFDINRLRTALIHDKAASLVLNYNCDQFDMLQLYDAEESVHSRRSLKSHSADPDNAWTTVNSIDSDRWTKSSHDGNLSLSYFNPCEPRCPNETNHSEINSLKPMLLYGYSYKAFCARLG